MLRASRSAAALLEYLGLGLSSHLCALPALDDRPSALAQGPFQRLRRRQLLRPVADDCAMGAREDPRGGVAFLHRAGWEASTVYAHSWQLLPAWIGVVLT